MPPGQQTERLGSPSSASWRSAAATSWLRSFDASGSRGKCLPAGGSYGQAGDVTQSALAAFAFDRRLLGFF